MTASQRKPQADCTELGPLVRIMPASSCIPCSASFDFNDPASGNTITTRLNVRTLSLLYAVTYQF